MYYENREERTPGSWVLEERVKVISAAKKVVLAG